MITSIGPGDARHHPLAFAKAAAIAMAVALWGRKAGRLCASSGDAIQSVFSFSRIEPYGNAARLL
jgi:hypothetical protein